MKYPDYTLKKKSVGEVTLGLVTHFLHFVT